MYDREEALKVAIKQRKFLLDRLIPSPEPSDVEFSGQTFERKTIMTLRSACHFDYRVIYQVSGLALPPLPLRSTNIKNKLHTSAYYSGQQVNDSYQL